MQNSEPEIFSDKYCSVKKSDNRLTILMNQSKVSLFYQFLIILIILFAIIFLYILITIYSIIGGLSFLFLAFFFPCLYLHTKFQKHTLTIDKSSQIITSQKVFTYLKQIRTFSFSDIEWLLYRRYQGEYGELYKLEFVLKNIKDLRFFKGSKDKCKQLGIIISDFIDKKSYGPVTRDFF